jgi:hypothetical protein
VDVSLQPEGGESKERGKGIVVPRGDPGSERLDRDLDGVSLSTDPADNHQSLSQLPPPLPARTNDELVQQVQHPHLVRLQDRTLASSRSPSMAVSFPSVALELADSCTTCLESRCVAVFRSRSSSASSLVGLCRQLVFPPSFLRLRKPSFPPFRLQSLRLRDRWLITCVVLVYSLSLLGDLLDHQVFDRRPTPRTRPEPRPSSVQDHNLFVSFSGLSRSSLPIRSCHLTYTYTLLGTSDRRGGESTLGSRRGGG